MTVLKCAKDCCFNTVPSSRLELKTSDKFFCSTKCSTLDYADCLDDECEHGDIDDMHCLDCGKDMTEEMMLSAYDMAKNFRKYGE